MKFSWHFMKSYKFFYAAQNCVGRFVVISFALLLILLNSNLISGSYLPLLLLWFYSHHTFEFDIIL